MTFPILVLAVWKLQFEWFLSSTLTSCFILICFLCKPHDLSSEMICSDSLASYILEMCLSLLFRSPWPRQNNLLSHRCVNKMQTMVHFVLLPDESLAQHCVLVHMIDGKIHCRKKANTACCGQFGTNNAQPSQFVSSTEKYCSPTTSC